MDMLDSSVLTSFIFLTAHLLAAAGVWFYRRRRAQLSDRDALLIVRVHWSVLHPLGWRSCGAGPCPVGTRKEGSPGLPSISSNAPRSRSAPGGEQDYSLDFSGPGARSRAVHIETACPRSAASAGANRPLGPSDRVGDIIREGRGPEPAALPFS
ncbi:hypothetical protein AAFF_G00196120 [Aldrovandia affinis]|uniref:Uncharacterized protein n=1 Tax=Aldrovandia affinis TaxID=143900 RepID=A0AAD7RIP7_9TELE|nr:hypothetical protein AAFF_G00196120 [Aldrovandia affinis]